MSHAVLLLAMRIPEALDCEQSLFFFGIVEESAQFAIARLQAASGEAASHKERGRKPEESKNNDCNGFIHKS